MKQLKKAESNDSIRVDRFAVIKVISEDLMRPLQYAIELLHNNIMYSNDKGMYRVLDITGNNITETLKLYCNKGTNFIQDIIAEIVNIIEQLILKFSNFSSRYVMPTDDGVNAGKCVAIEVPRFHNEIFHFEQNFIVQYLRNMRDFVDNISIRIDGFTGEEISSACISNIVSGLRANF